MTGFLDCNKDTLPEDMRALLASAKNPILSRIFSDTVYFGASAGKTDDLLSGDRHAAIKFLLLPDEDVGDMSISSANVTAAGAGAGTLSSSTSSDIVANDEREFAISQHILNEGQTHSNSHHPSHGHGHGLSQSQSQGIANRTQHPRGSVVSKRRNSFMMAEAVTMKFKTQLNHLMEIISSTKVQYVRCIKPNPNKSKDEFYRPLVVEQLRSAGMIEAIRISRSAYPNRLLYTDFLNRFRCLRARQWQESCVQNFRTTLKTVVGDANAVRNAANTHVGKELLLSVAAEDPTKWHLSTYEVSKYLNEFQFGANKVYFSSETSDKLESLRNRSLVSYAIVVQKQVRSYLSKMKFVFARVMAVCIQCHTRRYLQRKKYLKVLSGCVSIQSIIRMRLGVIAVQRLRVYRASTRIQSIVRGRKLRIHYQRARHAATAVASLMRMCLQRKRFIVMRDHDRKMKDLYARLAFFQVLVSHT